MPAVIEGTERLHTYAGGRILSAKRCGCELSGAIASLSGVVATLSDTIQPHWGREIRPHNHKGRQLRRALGLYSNVRIERTIESQRVA